MSHALQVETINARLFLELRKYFPPPSIVLYFFGKKQTSWHKRCHNSFNGDGLPPKIWQHFPPKKKNAKPSGIGFFLEYNIRCRNWYNVTTASCDDYNHDGPLGAFPYVNGIYIRHEAKFPVTCFVFCRSNYYILLPILLLPYFCYDRYVYHYFSHGYRFATFV